MTLGNLIPFLDFAISCYILNLAIDPIELLLKLNLNAEF